MQHSEKPKSVMYAKGAGNEYIESEWNVLANQTLVDYDYFFKIHNPNWEFVFRPY
jgi:hypothetical protein